MVRIVLIRPGLTDFDEQGRIKGTLDIPLNARGANQVAQTIEAVTPLKIETIYTSPCQAAEETAQAISEALGVRVKVVEKLANLHHGLWEGALIEDLRQRQPKAYRQLQEHPETVCPPEGEPLADAQQRVEAALEKVLRKHSGGVIAIVVPEPICSLARSYLEQTDLGDLWKAECQCGDWQTIEVNS